MYAKINVKDSQADSVDAHQVHLERIRANINIELRGDQWSRTSLELGTTIRPSCYGPERAIFL